MLVVSLGVPHHMPATKRNLERGAARELRIAEVEAEIALVTEREASAANEVERAKARQAMVALRCEYSGLLRKRPRGKSTKQTALFATRKNQSAEVEQLKANAEKLQADLDAARRRADMLEACAARAHELAREVQSQREEVEDAREVAQMWKGRAEKAAVEVRERAERAERQAQTLTSRIGELTRQVQRQEQTAAEWRAQADQAARAAAQARAEVQAERDAAAQWRAQADQAAAKLQVKMDRFLLVDQNGAAPVVLEYGTTEEDAAKLYAKAARRKGQFAVLACTDYQPTKKGKGSR